MSVKAGRFRHYKGNEYIVIGIARHSFMYSYPNLIPLPASTVRRIVASVEPFDFDRIYGAWWGKTVFTDAKAAAWRSAERYIEALDELQRSPLHVKEST